MPKGVFERTDKHREIYRQNGKKRLGKTPVNAKVLVGFESEDMVVVGRLTAPGSKSSSYWFCRCMLCGKEITLSNKQLLACYKTKCCSKNKRNHNWTGYEEISGAYWTRVKHQAEA